MIRFCQGQRAFHLKSFKIPNLEYTQTKAREMDLGEGYKISTKLLQKY